MKIEKTAAGVMVKMSRAEWLQIGKQAGWEDQQTEVMPILDTFSQLIDDLEGLLKILRQSNADGIISKDFLKYRSTRTLSKLDNLNGVDEARPILQRISDAIYDLDGLCKDESSCDLKSIIDRIDFALVELKDFYRKSTKEF